jgi:hypothetical protein
MFKVGLALAGAAVAQEPFTESAKFERWSHFKDYGVPAVMGKDALNSAAIADGSCRFVGDFDGYSFWRYPERVQRVLQALADAPQTSNPSNFTLSVEDALRDACSDKGEKPTQTGYELKSMAGSMQNWYRALAAPPADPSWQGQFDPAYQPQQVALTTGFVCIAACDLNNGELDASAMHSLAQEFPELRKVVKTVFPWIVGNSRFSGANSFNDLATELTPLLQKPCGCKRQPSALEGGYCPDNLQAVYADMHDGDMKEVTISGTSLIIKPSGNNQTWVVNTHVDRKSCTASIDFNVPGKPGPPPVNLLATLWYSSSHSGKKTVFEFTDPSGTLAAKDLPLNHWVEEVKKENPSAYKCPTKLQAVYADMHDGDRKEIIISGTSLTIKPSGNNQTWLVKSEVDTNSCSASINFNVPGKPSPPPVNLQAMLQSISSVTTTKTVFEFTDPTGTLAAPLMPLNQWVSTSDAMAGSAIMI